MPQKDPKILIQKAVNPTPVRIKKHHHRDPDVGIGILISMPSHRASEPPSKMIEYYGEYIGRGQSKTAFELHCQGARFHGQVLKVSQEHDKEPSVFMEACKSSLTTDILYECDGVDATSGRRFHCWITNRTIPLDEICRSELASKSHCSAAAYLCLLKAAHFGLYLSDCQFLDFGPLVTENDTEHSIVIIDAGSRGICLDKHWKKS